MKHPRRRHLGLCGFVLWGGALGLVFFLGPIEPKGRVAQAAQARFLPVLADFPVAPLLKAESDERVLFDTPQGRIVELMIPYAESAAGLTSNARHEALRAFYDATLPALGWTGDFSKGYVRGNEALVIRPVAQPDGLEGVLVHLAPLAD